MLLVHFNHVISFLFVVVGVTNTLEINLLSDIWFANIFTYSIDGVSPLLIVSLPE